MKSNKGFTLIELLAVIVILSILALIIGISITKSIKDSKEQTYQTQINSIKSSAEMWVADNIGNINAGCIYITLKRLQDDGYADLNIKNPKNNNESFSPTTTYIKINVTSVSGNLSFAYDVSLGSAPSGCSAFNN